MEKSVYMGLGGNVGSVYQSFQQALNFLQEMPEIKEIELSKIYQTTPVSDIPQPPYLNAVCRFQTTFDPFVLLRKSQEIQKKLGQNPKPQNARRIIDLDILFYGDEKYETPELQIPHPRWQERLFVLIPLSDLTEQLTFLDRGPVDIKELIKNFHNKHQETVLLWEKENET